MSQPRIYLGEDDRWWCTGQKRACARSFANEQGAKHHLTVVHSDDPSRRMRARGQVELARKLLAKVQLEQRRLEEIELLARELLARASREDVA